MTEHIKMEQVDIIKNTRFLCDFDGCEKDFKQKSHLTGHKKSVHLGIKFECKLCDYKASAKILVDGHIGKVHEGKTFYCSLCGKEFNLLQTLKTHKKVSHGNKTFACKLCEHKTTLKESLNKHFLAVHERIRYACPHCDHKSQKGYLTAHIKAEHKGQRYKCDKCDFTVKYQSNLIPHKKRYHESWVLTSEQDSIVLKACMKSNEKSKANLQNLTESEKYKTETHRTIRQDGKNEQSIVLSNKTTMTFYPIKEDS